MAIITRAGKGAPLTNAEIDATTNTLADAISDLGANKVDNTDPRLSDARPPTGGAGGVLSGAYPNPGFAVDMATQAELDAAVGTLDAVKLNANDASVTNAREWTATTVSQTEAETGAATTRRAWTAQRVWQAIAAWWNGVTSAFGRTFVASADAAAARTALALGTAATATLTTSRSDATLGRVLKAGDFGLGTGMSLGANYDLNNLTNSGNYRAEAGEINGPSTPITYGQIVVSRAVDTIMQMATRYTDARTFIRAGRLAEVGGSGSWTPWREIYHTGNLTIGTSGDAVGKLNTANTWGSTQSFNGAITSVNGLNCANGVHFGSYSGGAYATLIGGTTANGALIRGTVNGHVAVMIDGNEDSDSFSVVSYASGSDTGSNKTPDKLAFRVRRQGDGMFAGPVTASGFQGTGGGTAAAPSFTWTGFLTTGLYRPEASVIGFTCAGAERGRINTTGFSGNGSQLTALNASNVSSGTLADARLSSNVPKLNAANTWAATQIIGNGNKLSFVNQVTTNDHIQLYAQGSAVGYGLGVESNTLYYRSGTNHRWYSGSLANGGSANVRMGLDGGGNLKIQGGLDASGFTKLGEAAPNIKTKKLTVTTAGSQGGQTTVAHGLSRDKIISVTALVPNDPGDLVAPGFTSVGGLEYGLIVYSSTIGIYLKSSNSAGILSKTARIYITYEE